MKISWIKFFFPLTLRCGWVLWALYVPSASIHLATVQNRSTGPYVQCSPFSLFPQQQLKAVLNLSVRLKLASQNTAGPWCLTCKLTTTILSQNLTLKRVLSQSTSASSKERVDLLVALLLLLLLVIIWPGWTKARWSLKEKNAQASLFCLFSPGCLSSVGSSLVWGLLQPVKGKCCQFLSFISGEAIF